MKGRKKKRQPLSCPPREKGLKLKNVVEELTDPSDLLSLFITTPHSHVRLHFLLGSFQRKELAFFFASAKLAKAFLIFLAKSSWAGPWPLSFLLLWGGTESKEGDRQVTYLIEGVGSALSILASQRVQGSPPWFRHQAPSQWQPGALEGMLWGCGKER